jgi:hypothetical protein
MQIPDSKALEIFAVAGNHSAVAQGGVSEAVPNHSLSAKPEESHKAHAAPQCSCDRWTIGKRVGE